MISRNRRHHQNGVGLLGVQRAIGDVRDRKILDNLAAFQLEVAFAEQRLVRRCCGECAAAGNDRGRPAGTTYAMRFIWLLPLGSQALLRATSGGRDALVPKTLLGSKSSQTARFCTVKGGGSARQGFQRTKDACPGPFGCLLGTGDQQMTGAAAAARRWKLAVCHPADAALLRGYTCRRARGCCGHGHDKAPVR